MNSALLTAAAISALAMSSSFAADLPTKKAPPAPVVVAPFSWTGFYIGAEGGYGWGQSTGTVPNIASLSQYGFPSSICPDCTFTPTAVPGLGSPNASGGIGGVRTGYNYQTGQFVLGGEADIEWSGMSAHKSMSWHTNEGAGFSALSVRSNWQGSLRARAGVAFDRLLVYATGGAAFANVSSSFSGYDPCAFGYWQFYDLGPCYISSFVNPHQTANPYGLFASSHSSTLWGWTLGAGAEWAFNEHWSATAEVRYASFGKNNLSVPATWVNFNGAPPTILYSVLRLGFNETLAQVGINYRF